MCFCLSLLPCVCVCVCLTLPSCAWIHTACFFEEQHSRGMHTASLSSTDHCVGPALSLHGSASKEGIFSLLLRSIESRRWPVCIRVYAHDLPRAVASAVVASGLLRHDLCEASEPMASTLRRGLARFRASLASPACPPPASTPEAPQQRSDKLRRYEGGDFRRGRPNVWLNVSEESEPGRAGSGPTGPNPCDWAASGTELHDDRSHRHGSPRRDPAATRPDLWCWTV